MGTVIAIDAEGVEIDARLQNGVWVVNDGHNTARVETIDDMLAEIEHIVDFHDLDTDMAALRRDVAAAQLAAKIDGFYYSDDERLSGEPQFATDLDSVYQKYTSIFDDPVSRGEFESMWTYIDADDISTDETLRDNLRNDLRYVHDARIRTFVENALAKYE